MIAKKLLLDKARQESFDIAIGTLHLEENILTKMRKWFYPKRLELHQTWDSISNEKKLFVSTGLKFCVQLFSEYKATSQAVYDLSINLQYSFINEILSLPTINRYLIPLLEKKVVQIDFKLLF